MLHSAHDDMLEPLNENYPLALMPIVNKPLIAYQLEYLEKYKITDIIVTCSKHAQKIDKYLKNHYKPLQKELNVELVVFHEEEGEESIAMLKLLQPKIHSDFIVMEGSSLFDVPLDKILETHLLSEASITTLLKEFDPDKKGTGPKIADVESTDIFGVSGKSDV